MVDLHLARLLLLILPPLIFFILAGKRNPPSSKIPTRYPLLGSIFHILKNRDRLVPWVSNILLSTPNLTFTLHRPFGQHQVFTANSANVSHILKSAFHKYPKGDLLRDMLRDLLGDGIFNADGDIWKFQRQVSSHQFNTRSLRKFVEQVVDVELDSRLIPILENAAGKRDAFLDMQDVLQRFAFDNICKIAFGYDPAYLAPSLPEEEFARTFDESLRLTGKRFNTFFPFAWRIKRALGVGTEKELMINVAKIREFAKEIVREKKKTCSSSSLAEDLLSRFMSSGHSDEDFVIDIVISFILAGRDTTSSALTWFFWLVSKNPRVEEKIVEEIKVNDYEAAKINGESLSSISEARSLVYTHAAICESMRLYPPVPVSTKTAGDDDVLPDGTPVKKGWRVSYHPYAMGRVEEVWGADWPEFRPERWLRREEEGGGKWEFVGKDAYTYPVFQAGPRVCMGKEMAFLQMKRVVAGVLRRFRVAPAEGSGEPVYVVEATSKMRGGFMVKIEERVGFSGVG
ncbi:Cytochrome P450 94B1 [Striga hermonthica]|uniref:Cytochrome P450 94B1 n=1 Tax=Striga hermonthica TaxID=68872 RepID=A0A9N7NCQ6_STRHE|nr:Cytochrome P450 94B1 [Striga hermonthica]